MGSVERRQREKESLREAILDAARELFATEGYDAVTMRKIAEKIEYSPTAIYQHFADKLSLVRELCVVDFAGLASRFQGVAAIADPVERLRAIGGIYVGFARAYPNHYRFMFMTSRPPDFEKPDECLTGDPTQDAYALLRGTCAEAIAADRLRPELDDPDEAAQLFWGSVHGVIALQLADGGKRMIDWRPLEALTDRLSEILLRGMVR